MVKTMRDSSRLKLSNMDYITQATTSIGPQTERYKFISMKSIATKKKPKEVSIEPVSGILNEEKTLLHINLKLLDAHSGRNSYHCIEELGNMPQTARTHQESKKSITLMTANREVTGQLGRNDFYYTSIEIKDKYQPVTILIRVHKGDPQSKIRMFASTIIQQPNRFNAEMEVTGRLMRFPSTHDTFRDKFLYLTIFSQSEIRFSVSAEFGRPQTKRYIPRLDANQPIENPNLFDEIQEVLARRRLKLGNCNFIERNKELRAVKKCAVSEIDFYKIRQVRDKVIELQQNNRFKRKAQVQIHDVATEIHQKQIVMQRDINFRQYIHTSWLKMFYLVNVMVPRINEIVINYRTMVAKNMKKQVVLTMLLKKFQRRIAQFGPQLKIRCLLQSKLCMHLVIDVTRVKAKKRSLSIVCDLLQSNIVAYITERNGTYVVNLMLHKNSRLQFTSNLKHFIITQYKLLYSDVSRFSKQIEQKQVSGIKKDPIHFLMHDSQFILQQSKKIMYSIYQKWNTNFAFYRAAVQEQSKSSVALFLKPPKLFELPHENVVRNFLLEELDKRGLITDDYKL